MAGLLRPQQIAGAADLQVPHGDLEASSELGHLLDDLEPLLGVSSTLPVAGTSR